MKKDQSRRPEPPFDGHEEMDPPGLESNLDPAPKWRAPNYRAADKLKGKVALITGGDSGIGRAVAMLYAREGADVAILAMEREKDDAETIREAITEQGCECLVLLGDVRDRAFCRHAVEEVVERFGKLDILVNNAAYQRHVEDLSDLSFEQWDRTFETNISGYFNMVKAAIAHLPDGGAIVNTGSITGLEGSPALLDYSATKGAIHAFTKSLAQMLVKHRVRVNCVAPGPVWTPLNPAERDAEEVREFGSDTPYGRPAQPEEIAPAYVFFASEADSSYITGEVMTALGGQTRAG